MENDFTKHEVCQRCGRTERLAFVSGKVGDMCCFVSNELYKPSYYVPVKMGIGGGSYITFTYCLDCGQIQGDFPISIQRS